MKRGMGLAWVVATASIAGGCGSNGGAVSDRGERVASALSSPGPASSAAPAYYYLRCNSTAWALNDNSRFAPTADPGVLELAFGVREPWMLSGGGGDSCIVNGTAARDEWGTDYSSFGATPVQIAAPAGVQLQPQPEGHVQNFSLTYPAAGRYRARLNTKENFIAITPDTPVPGDVEWASSGTLSFDGQGRLFRTHLGDESSVARVDATSGDPTWVFTSAADAYLEFDASCAFADVVVISGQKEIFGVDPTTGATRWVTDVSAALASSGASPYLRCRADIGALYMTFTTVTGTGAAAKSSSHFARLDKETGAVLFTYDTPSYASISAMTTRGAIVSTYESSGGTASLLNGATGKLDWTLPSIVSYGVQPGPGDDLYISSHYQVRSIDVATGKDRFVLSSLNEFPWLTFENGGVYLRDKEALTKINPMTGASLWSYAYGATTYQSALILPTGQVAVYGTDPETHQTSLTLLAADGQPKWTRVVGDNGSWPAQDSSGDLFIRTQATLTRVDVMTGAPLWVFTLPLPPASNPPLPFNGGLSEVVAADTKSVYVTFTGAGYKYPPMGIVSLDLSTGAPLWRHDEKGGISVVGADATRLFVSAGYFGTAAKVLLK